MKFTKEVLQNNLRVITTPMSGVKSVTVLVIVGVGSRYESKENKGLAHFSEHMFFKGTNIRPSTLAISSIIDGVGAEFNAFTSKEYAGFFIKAASSHLELALDVLSDILLNSKFDQVEIEREKDVILEEMRMYFDTPMRHVSTIYESLLFGDHPLGWDIVGTENTISNLMHNDFERYVKQHYIPDNMVVGVAGDTSTDNALKTVKKYLGSYSGGSSTDYLKYVSTQQHSAVSLFYKDTEQAHFALGVRSYPIGHPKHYIAAVLSNVLGGSMSSRLFIELRERRGLGYYVRCGLDEYLDAGTLVVQAGVQKPKIEEAISVTLQELHKIKGHKVSEDELKRAKEYLKGKIILELEDSKEVAALHVLQEVLEKEIKTPEEIINEIDSVTAEQILAVANELIDEKTLNLAMIGPYKEETKFLDLLKL